MRELTRESLEPIDSVEALESLCSCRYALLFWVVLSKDPVLRYQVGTKKMKTSRYHVSLSPGGTEDPVNPVLAA